MKQFSIDSHGLGLRVVGLIRALKLGTPIRLILKCAPTKAQVWYANWRMNILMRSGHRLVPEEALEAKYREALLALMEEYGPSSLGDYLEFGVCHGTSMACMYRASAALELGHVRLFGFDSFEGLPDAAKTDDGGVWVPGTYKYNKRHAINFLKRQGVNLDRVILIKGWFRDTLNEELVDKYNITKASVIMVDCDMYLSAKEALSFCGPLIQDASIVFFDDWHSNGLAARNMGERRAFEEFLSDNPELTAEGFGSYHPNTEIFLVKRVPEALGDGRPSQAESPR